MNAITPSMMAATTPRVIACWIGCTAPMREKMSPTWRFSKKSAGSRIMWRTRLPTIWKLRRWPNTFSAQPRSASIDGLDDDQGAERERQNEQKVLVVVEHRFVDDELDLERRGEGRDLQRHRERDHLDQRAPHAGHLRPQAGQADRRLGLHRTEARRRRELEHDAGEMLGEFRQRQLADADRRIVDHGAAWR